jgi:hypothetical protein
MTKQPCGGTLELARGIPSRRSLRLDPVRRLLYDSVAALSHHRAVRVLQNQEATEKSGREWVAVGRGGRRHHHSSPPVRGGQGSSCEFTHGAKRTRITTVSVDKERR